MKKISKNFKLLNQIQFYSILRRRKKPKEKWISIPNYPRGTIKHTQYNILLLPLCTLSLPLSSKPRLNHTSRMQYLTFNVQIHISISGLTMFILKVFLLFYSWTMKFVIFASFLFFFSFIFESRDCNFIFHLLHRHGGRLFLVYTATWIPPELVLCESDYGYFFWVFWK